MKPSLQLARALHVEEFSRGHTAFENERISSTESLVFAL